MKRIFLFVITNIAVIAVLAIFLQIFGFTTYLEEEGINYMALLVFSAVFGFGGALISLAMSKPMAKMATGAKVIDQPRSESEQWLVETVRRQAQQAGIGMPEVAIYDAPDVNAFATGARRDSALVAVSTGLLHAMSRDEAEAVLGHEVSHVANGDMVTMTLLQGVLNTFVIFFARIIGHTVDKVVFKNEQGHGIGFFVVYFVAQIVLGILASMIVFWFSRQREFRADAGGASLAGRNKMIAALQRLKSSHEESKLPDQLAAFGISGRSGIARLFMSHPPLDERIAALQSGAR